MSGLSQLAKASTLTLSFWLILISPTPSYSQDAWTRNDTNLLDKPMKNADVVARLFAKKSAKILRRNGFWVEVQVDGNAGWLKLSALRFQKDTNFKGSLTRLRSGREGIENNVAATGVRGLEAKTIELADPDYKAFSKLLLVNLSIELKKELHDIKEPRVVGDIVFKQSPKPVNPKSDRRPQKLKSKPSRALEVDDDF